MQCTQMVQERMGMGTSSIKSKYESLSLVLLLYILGYYNIWLNDNDYHYHITTVDDNDYHLHIVIMYHNWIVDIV